MRNLWDIVAGKCAGRTSRERRILFKHATGLGIWYASTGACALDRARARGMGRELPGEMFLQDMVP